MVWSGPSFGVALTASVCKQKIQLQEPIFPILLFLQFVTNNQTGLNHLTLGVTGQYNLYFPISYNVW